MCGLFGFSFKNGKMSAARRAVLATNLAYYNSMRGVDSWGIVGINADGIHVSRGLGDISDNAYQLCEYNTLFAHTRYATGNSTVNVANAHPFKVGKILGAHNGMVYNHHELNEKYGRNFQVDSQHLFAHINEKRSFSELYGYGAIEWIRTDDPKSINLCKLLDGELSVYGVGEENKIDGVVWSSSQNHLLKSFDASGITEFVRYEMRRSNIYSVNNGTLYINNNEAKLELTKLPERKQDDNEVISQVKGRSAPYKSLLREHGANDDYSLWFKAYSLRSEV